MSHTSLPASTPPTQGEDKPFSLEDKAKIYWMISFCQRRREGSEPFDSMVAKATMDEVLMQTNPHAPIAKRCIKLWVEIDSSQPPPDYTA